MDSVSAHEVALPLGVVVERRTSDHPWADWIWKPIAVFSGAEPTDGWQKMLESNGLVQYHAATLELTLHRKETEAYIENLLSPQPVAYVILQEAEDSDSDFPWEVHAVTASPYEAQDYEDTGDDIIEKVMMPDEVAAFVQAFVERHHVEQKFIKRKRDKMKLEDQKFGKQPIFERPTRH